MNESDPQRAAVPWTSLAAWAVIVAVVVWVLSVPGRDLGDAPERIESEVGVRAALAFRSLGAKDDESVLREFFSLDNGDIAMRQRAVVLAGEMWGTERAARHALATERPAAEAGGETARVHEVLTALYPASPPAGETQGARVARLTADERALLLRGLGWFGRLAMAPADGDPAARADLVASERRTAFAVGAIMTFVLLGGLAGCVLVLVALVLALLGRLGLRHDVPPGRPSFGADTFAVWLVVAVVVFRVVSPLLPLDGTPGRLLLFAAELASLGVLALGVARGVAWPELRRRIGWHRGAGFVREALAGLVGALVAAAGTGAGLLLWTSFAAASGREHVAGEGSHPIVVELARGAIPDAFVLVLLGAVAAPVVEETMFRGVLYGHLREATSRWPRALSVAAGALVSGVVFASLHPQGWTAVPPLAGMGVALALVREWRGSLVAPMVTHAVWNGSLLLLVRIALAP